MRKVLFSFPCFQINQTKLHNFLLIIHTTNNAIYGYKKDPEDKDHWLVDEEAAAVVRRIFRLAVEGHGPYEISKIWSGRQYGEWCGKRRKDSRLLKRKRAKRGNGKSYTVPSL